MLWPAYRRSFKAEVSRSQRTQQCSWPNVCSHMLSGCIRQPAGVAHCSWSDVSVPRGEFRA